MTLGNEQTVRQACKIAEDKDLEGWVMPACPHLSPGRTAGFMTRWSGAGR
jgi:hypothetical protein